MTYHRNYDSVNCHWCGGYAKRYKSYDKHIFCSNRCKMAHYRAYKKYVTHLTGEQQLQQARSVTHHVSKKTTKATADKLQKNPAERPGIRKGRSG